MIAIESRFVDAVHVDQLTIQTSCFAYPAKEVSVVYHVMEESLKEQRRIGCFSNHLRISAKRTLQISPCRLHDI